VVLSRNPVFFSSFTSDRIHSHTRYAAAQLP
jgi:hypothetical protein